MAEVFRPAPAARGPTVGRWHNFPDHSKIEYGDVNADGDQLPERRLGCVGRTEQPCNGRRCILLDDSFQITTLTNDSPRDDWHSVAVCSDGSYEVEEGLISSFPVRVLGGKWEIVQERPINECSWEKIDNSIGELKEEKSLVSNLIR